MKYRKNSKYSIELFFSIFILCFAFYIGDCSGYSRGVHEAKENFYKETYKMGLLKARWSEAEYEMRERIKQLEVENMRLHGNK